MTPEEMYEEYRKRMALLETDIERIRLENRETKISLTERFDLKFDNFERRIFARLGLDTQTKSYKWQVWGLIFIGTITFLNFCVVTAPIIYHFFTH